MFLGQLHEPLEVEGVALFPGHRVDHRGIAVGVGDDLQFPGLNAALAAWSEGGISAQDLATFLDLTNKDLKLALCDNAVCSSALLILIDSEGSVGRHTSVTIGSDGLPIISYRDSTNKDLKVAHCDDAACSTFTISIVDNDFSQVGPTSIAIGSDGLPVITYPSKIAHCKDVKCSAN